VRGEKLYTTQLGEEESRGGDSSVSGALILEGTLCVGESLSSKELKLEGRQDFGYTIRCKSLQNSPFQLRFRFEDTTRIRRTIKSFYIETSLQRGAFDHPPSSMRVWVECLLGTVQFSFQATDRDLPLHPSNVALLPGSVLWVDPEGNLGTLENNTPLDYFGTDIEGEPGFHTLPEGGTGTHQHVWNESPMGVQNSVNKVYTLSDSPCPQISLMLFRNGLLMRKDDDYTLVGSTITMTRAPKSGENFLASYTV